MVPVCNTCTSLHQGTAATCGALMTSLAILKRSLKFARHETGAYNFWVSGRKIMREQATRCIIQRDHLTLPGV